MRNQRTKATASILLNLKTPHMQYLFLCQFTLPGVTFLKKKEMVQGYLTGPAKKITVRQVNRPTETTASWLSLPCCHTNSAVSMNWCGSSSSRLCNTGTPPLLWLLEVESLEGLGFAGMVCWPTREANLSGNLSKDAATRKAHIRRVRTRNKMMVTGDDTELVPCGTKNTFLLAILVFL